MWPSVGAKSGFVVVGEEAHIVAEEPDGPRGQSPLTTAERDEYDNLILLCRKHHKIVDSDVVTYTVDSLHAMRDKHESSMSQAVDKVHLYWDEAWAAIVDDFASRMELDCWETRMSGFVRTSQGARESTLDLLQEVGVWLNGRIFPATYPSLRHSLETFQEVSIDLLTVFSRHADQAFAGEDPWIRSDRYYKRPYPNPNYYRDLTAFEKHFNLVNDLALELCRVANWFCDEVRRSIDPSFMTARGAMQLEGGPYQDGITHWLRPEYAAEDIADGTPYPGLDSFATVVRYERDIHSRPNA
jgi:hypothetical protein